MNADIEDGDSWIIEVESHLAWFEVGVVEDRHLDLLALGVGWTDGRDVWSTRGLISEVEHASWPILTPGCPVEAGAIAALDDRALGMIPPLHAFIRGSASSAG